MKNESILKWFAIIGMIIALVIILPLYKISLVSTNEIEQTIKYETSLFQDNRVMSVNIIMSDNEWDDMLENVMEETYTTCDVEVNGKLYRNVGIRPKGNTSLSQVASDDTTDRYSFKIEFDKYVDGQTLDGLDKLCLNNMMSDKTYMKEYLSYDILSYMGVNSPLCSYASITRNGEIWGLYLAVEAVENSFIERNYGSTEGNLYKPENSKNMMPDMADMAKFMMNKGNDQSEDLLDQENMQQFRMKMKEAMGMKEGMEMPIGSDLSYIDHDKDSYDVIWDGTIFDITNHDKEVVITALDHISSQTELDSYLDIDQMLRYMAVSALLINDDSYFGTMCHNYYLYESEGKLAMIPWDFNLSFGGFGANGSDTKEMINRAIDSVIPTGKIEDRAFIAAALSTDEAIEQYHEYLSELLVEYFMNGRFEKTVMETSTLIDSYVKNDPTIFNSYEEYKEGMDDLILFGTLRATSIQKQLDGEIPSLLNERTGSGYTLMDVSELDLETMGIQAGGHENGNMPSFKEMNHNRNMEIPSMQEQNNNLILYVGISIFCMLVGLFIIKGWKRKKF